MGYVIAGILVLVIVVAGVAVLTLAARRHGGQGGRAAGDASYGGGAPGSETAIFAEDDRVPLGDTAEHAGEQRDGETVGEQDARHSGGSGRPVTSGYARTGEPGTPPEERGRGAGDRPASG